MKRHIIITSIAVCTGLSIGGGYLLFANQQATAPEEKTTTVTESIPEQKDPKKPKTDLKIGSNKDNFHLEKNFGDKKLKVERITGRVSQSSLKKRTVIKMKPKDTTTEEKPVTKPKKQTVTPVKPAPSKPEPEEDTPAKISPFYDKERVMTPINNQLATLDLATLEAKEALVVGADVTKLQQLIATKQLSYKELAGIYLNRIKKYDQNGLTLNAVTEISPTIIAEAEQLDKEAATNKSALYGMPVLLKDNIGTKEIPTSAGTVALKNWVVGQDAAIVEKLKASGALILGKTNMSEWAAGMDDEIPNGYSGKKGQGKNPYSLDLDPSGSSSGSATAATSDFAAITIGTETNGSIITPASAQSAVGYKPTQGLVNNAGIIPLSSRFDTPGPLTKTVTDAYLTTNILTNTVNQQPLSTDALKGKRIGLLADGESNEETAVIKKIKKDLEKAGATIVNGIAIGEFEQVDVDFSRLLNADFKYDLNQFLQTNHAPMTSLESIITFNQTDPARNMKYGQSELVKAQQSTTTRQQANSLASNLIGTAQKELDSVLQKDRLDAVVTIGMGGSILFLAPIAGNPELTIPAGYDPETNQPISLTFITARNSDTALLNMGYAYEQQSKNRKSPNLK
ncbi:amidase family protein [Listeria swaminathanii]|uniref:Amidase family protein n=1 Tax=Listeria swaminathanii TaxID=2713501 RepID=A0ABU2ID11_9LIST|nr:amidase family protein [Listeria swaminathanii]MDT0016134.1 amidase family protein [Listeria swaminathanii]MDT0021570.1 amidase family protein [Listeria swaminathanii]MDT0032534.1 amidase family protein [Listeria swaminathanii]MDT0051616.1 amidase family protein [Listeria swaminathanii]MDT0054381.1 amidase family protein [Listeria swaminathanii]